jgi:hypothetical protein
MSLLVVENNRTLEGTGVVDLITTRRLLKSADEEYGKGVV